MTNKPLFALEDILPVLPHRPPFLFVDRVMLLEPHKLIIAERTLRPDEPQFAGHFPGRAIMPGVLVTEALAQTSGLLLGLSERVTGAAPPESPKCFPRRQHHEIPASRRTRRHARAAGRERQNFGALFRFNVEATADGTSWPPARSRSPWFRANGRNIPP